MDRSYLNQDRIFFSTLHLKIDNILQLERKKRDISLSPLIIVSQSTWNNQLYVPDVFSKDCFNCGWNSIKKNAISKNYSGSRNWFYSMSLSFLIMFLKVIFINTQKEIVNMLEESIHYSRIKAKNTIDIVRLYRVS